MLLYHFTRAGAINDILKNGILPGKVPCQEHGKPKLVSLTSRLDPSGHGLITGQLLYEQTSPEFQFMASVYPQLITGQSPNRQLQLFDQTEVVVELDISDTDPNLLDYNSFINLILTQMNYSIIHKNLFKAAILVSTRYPLGHDHIATKKYDKEVRDVQYSGAISDPGWFLYDGTISPNMIKCIRTRDNQTGKYI